MTGTENGEAAQAFLDRLLGEEGRAALEDGGFGLAVDGTCALASRPEDGLRMSKDRTRRRGRPCARHLARHAQALGSCGAHPDRARPRQPAARPRVRGGEAPGRPCRAPERSEPLSRGRPGSSVEGLLAQVEIDVTEPARVVAVITRDAAEELGLKPGLEATAIVKATSVMVEL